MDRTREQERLQHRYGPWAVVTGASDGIGREIAAQLARAGLNLVLVARRLDRLEDIARQLTERHGVQARALEADLTHPAMVEGLAAQTSDLDVGLLVAAAGFGSSGAFLEAKPEEEVAMVDVNCRAVVALTHAFARRLAAQGRGGIVLLSSLVAFQGVPNAATYAATKAFVQSFAEGIHAELALKGVDVLASAPGPVQSGFAARANMRMGATVTATEVARATLWALGRRALVRPGFLSAALEAALTPLPRWARVRVMTQVMAGMTRHQGQPHQTSAGKP